MRFIEFIKPQYKYYRITPDTSIRNYNSSNIAKAICHIFKPIFQRIKIDNKCLKIEIPSKVTYLIDIRKDSISFIFIFPTYYELMLKEKLQEVWSKATIEEIKCINYFSDKALKYQLVYKNEDPLSLAVNKTSNDPLNSILNVVDIMKEGDRLGIIYNFIPRGQFNWQADYRSTMESIKDHKPIERQKTSLAYMFKMSLSILTLTLESFLEVVNDFIGGSKKKKLDVALLEAVTDLNKTNELSKGTRDKENSLVINTQLIVLSESLDSVREYNNAMAVCHSYKVLDEDNKLIYKPLKTKNVWHIEDFNVAGAEQNTMSVEECHNLLEVPGRDLLLQHKAIKRIDTSQSLTPKELAKGVMAIGVNTFKDKQEKVYLSNDREFRNLTLCICGPTRAGKTTLQQNLVKDSLSNGECNIIFDFIGNCEFSYEIMSIIDPGKTLVIDCENSSEGLGYNEAYENDSNPFIVYRNAKVQATQLATLVDSIVASDKNLSEKMRRYLNCAALIGFVHGASFGEIFNILKNHKYRHEMIENVNTELLIYLDEYIEELMELDEIKEDKKNGTAEPVGTRLQLIQGILDRVTKLKENTYMEMMLKRSTSNNINLREEIQKAQLIVIRMPEVLFSTEQEKDIYCTYWITKLWTALQIRKFNIPLEERIKVNIYFDELYQVPHCQEFLKSKLSQIAKFTAKPIISCHYLQQISIIRDELKSANASYMLIAGADKDNFSELKDELNNQGFELEDLLNLKRYHSLNLIKYEGGLWAGITKLPSPIK